MSAVTVKALLTPLSADAIRATMVATLITLGIPADKWIKGGVASTLLTVFATVLHMFSVLLSQVLGGGWLESASGNWLTLLGHYVYGVDRPEATFATGTLTLTNAGGGIYTYLAGQATFSDSTSGATYTNAADFTLNANTSLTINIIATEAGAASSAAVGKVDALVTFMLSVTCSNPSDVVGQDAMLDEPYRALCFAALGARSVRGVRTAYAYAIQVATNAVSGAGVNVNRWLVTPNSHTGHVGVVVASPAGIVDANDLTGVGTSIEAIARPDAITVDLTGATTVPYSKAITVWCEAAPGLVAQTVSDAVGESLLEYFEAFKIGGLSKGGPFALWATGLDGVVKSAYAGIFAVDGLDDLVLTVGQVPTNSITIAVRFA